MLGAIPLSDHFHFSNSRVLTHTNMSDPRNAAHDKKVSHDKEKEKKQHDAADAATATLEAPAPEETPLPAHHEAPAALEGSVAVLSQLKEMDFHSRANLERLAELMLTVDDQLKQKEFAKQVGDLFSAQDAFQTKLTELIQPYQGEITRMQGEAA